MEYINKFMDLLKEDFGYGSTYFKVMPSSDFEDVKKDGYLSPFGKITHDNNIYFGNWTIPTPNLEEWTTHIKYFGSPIQALFMKRPGTPTVLLHLKINPKDNRIYNRDITKMFVTPSFKGYYSSFSPNLKYKINESFITGNIYKYELVNEFTMPEDISKFVADPQSILDFIYGKGDIKYSDTRMTPIKTAFAKVILKKLLTLDFKNF